jgi:hypothetical protein
VFSVAYGLLKYKVAAYEWANCKANDNCSNSELDLLLNVTEWTLFGCAFMSVVILLIGLIIIRRTLRDAEHLMVNERYMALHLVFFLLSVGSSGFALAVKDTGAGIYYF